MIIDVLTDRHGFQKKSPSGWFERIEAIGAIGYYGASAAAAVPHLARIVEVRNSRIELIALRRGLTRKVPALVALCNIGTDDAIAVIDKFMLELIGLSQSKDEYARADARNTLKLISEVVKPEAEYKKRFENGELVLFHPMITKRLSEYDEIVKKQAPKEDATEQPSTNASPTGP